MKIRKTVETENGELEFEATLTEEEAKFVVEVGLNILLAQGSLPILQEKFRQLQEETTAERPEGISLQ